jgi:predicted dienelactone hydrolase
MKQALLVVVTAVMVVTAHAGQDQPRDYKPDVGPHEVAATQHTWKDEKRRRDVPVKIYAPQAGQGPFPVIAFSHGLGGTRDGYEYLGRHWASHGYICLHLQHHGSDDAAWKGSKDPLADLRRAAREPANAVNRPLDVRFALDELTRLNRTNPAFQGRLDLGRVGMAGHSFGGWTTQAMVGEMFVTPTGKAVALGDRRIKAAVIMSPSPPPGKPDLDRAFGPIQVPCLHLTGTKDDGMAITEVKAADRRLPFDHIRQADQYLVIFKGGDHMVFANARKKQGEGAKDARVHHLIRMSTTAFWDAYLGGDTGAAAWLQGQGLRQTLGTDGTFEWKRAAAK